MLRHETPSRVVSQEALYDLVQERTFRWFWECAGADSGMAPDRATAPPGIVTIGGTGFALTTLLVGAERGCAPRAGTRERIELIVSTLERAERHHGVFPHWLDTRSGTVVPFSPLDDGSDLVETALLIDPDLYHRGWATGPDFRNGRTAYGIELPLGPPLGGPLTDAFSETQGRYSSDYLAIDRGPIVIMMKNHRSGLLWHLFMQAPEVREGLKRPGFVSPHFA